MNKKTGVLLWSIILTAAVIVFLTLLFGDLKGDEENMTREWVFTESIQKLDIEWVSGNVNLNRWNGEGIKVVQTSWGSFSDKQILKADITNGTLKIRDGRKGFHLFSFGGTNLDIYVPDQSFEAMDLDSVSGDVKGTDLDISRINVESVSGNIHLSGAFAEVQVDTTSGSVMLTSETMLERMDLKAVSGSLTIMIPENDGFTLNFDKVSGGYSTDFNCTQENNRYTYKDGSAMFNADVVSGDVKILRLP